VLQGFSVRCSGGPAVLAALINAQGLPLVSVEPNGIARAIGTQRVYGSVPVAPGLWGLDRIDQVIRDLT
jgi:hypothetical protein